MNWTRKAPTVAGWYWWRRDQHALPGVAIACSDLSGYYMNRTGHNSTFDHVDDVIGEWLGPITPDSYQQGWVAGIKAVRRKITDLIDRGFTDYEEDMDDLIEWTDFQLAQQAQEGGVGE